MSEKYKEKKSSIIQNNRPKSYLDVLNNKNNEITNKVYKKSLSFQDTENMTYLDASSNNNIQDYLANNNRNNMVMNGNQFFNSQMKSSIDKSNYDRDDSLNDVISFGKQTPFRFDNSNMASYDHDGRINLGASNDYGNKSRDNDTNNNMSILNLKDTTIDEMFLMPDNMDRINQNFLKLETTPNTKNPLKKSDDFFNRINLNPEFELSFNMDTNDSKFLQSTTRNTQPGDSAIHPLYSGDSKLTATSKLSHSKNNLNTSGLTPKSRGQNSPSRIPVLASARSKTNLNESLNRTDLTHKELELENIKTLKDETKNKINGAFKLFVSGSNLNKMTNSEVSFTQKEQEFANSSNMVIKAETKSSPQVTKSTVQSKIQAAKKPTRTSPFVSLDKKKTKTAVKNQTGNKGNKKNEAEAERSRPPTVVNINYSLDSDESIMMDNLINNPTELKKILREGKMDKEQLNQLQENYLHLLEQYAEKENFIDTFRLGYNVNAAATAPVTPSANMFQETFPPQSQQTIELNTGTSTANSVTSAQHYGNQRSQLQTPINLSLQRQKAFTPNTIQSSDTNSTHNSVNNHQNLGNTGQSVFVISATNNRASTVPSVENPNQQPDECFSYYGGSGLSNTNSAENNNNQETNPLFEENIVVEQNSKLGILLQTKVLEDKMQSFVTLMKEKQLNKVEQIKVFDSIKTDYESLLKNYEVAKINDPTGVLPNQLDMDIDLNKELGKMKDLLTDIVDKMSNNLVEDTPRTGSVLSQEHLETGSSAKSVSSYGDGNHEELMDQYNRLLDVFNQESPNEPRDKALIDMITNQPNHTEEAIMQSETYNSQENVDVETSNFGQSELHEKDVHQINETNVTTTEKNDALRNHQSSDNQIHNQLSQASFALKQTAIKSIQHTNPPDVKANYTNSISTQILNGRSPKRTKQPSTTDSLSSESNTSHMNVRGTHKLDKFQTDHRISSTTPGKSLRHGSSKKISKISHNSNYKQSETSCDDYEKLKQLDRTIEHQKKIQQQKIQYQQQIQQQRNYDDNNLESSCCSTNQNVQKPNSPSVPGNEGLKRNENVAGNRKFVRVSKEKPFVSESEYDNTMNGFGSNNSGVVEVPPSWKQQTENLVKTSNDLKLKKQHNRSSGKNKQVEKPSHYVQVPMEQSGQSPSGNLKEGSQLNYQKARTPSRHSSKTSHRQVPKGYHHDQQPCLEESSYEMQRHETDDEEVTSKTEVISFTQEDYILQKMLENNSHSSSTASSSDQMILKKKKEELKLKKQMQSEKNNSTYSLNSTEFHCKPKKEYLSKPRMMPVARAYDISEDSSHEELDTISRFPAEEELYGSMQSKEPMNKSILQNQNNYQIQKSSSSKNSDSNLVNRHHGSQKMDYESYDKHHQVPKVRGHRQMAVTSPEPVVAYDSMSEGSSTEMESVIEVKSKPKHKHHTSKIEIKKELMKRLTDEVEHLKQHILKKHLKKVQEKVDREEEVTVKANKVYNILKTNQYISEDVDTTDLEIDHNHKHIYHSQAQLAQSDYKKSSEVRQRRPHNDYYSNTTSQRHRMRNSKSLENFDNLNSPPSDYHASHIPKYKSSKKLMYAQEMLPQPDPRSHQRTRKEQSRPMKTLSKKPSQSTESFGQKYSSQNFYHGSLVDKQYLYDRYGRLVSVPSAQRVHTTGSVNSTYALNEIDPNVMGKVKSQHKLAVPSIQGKQNLAMQAGYVGGLNGEAHRNFIGFSESNLLSNHLYDGKATSGAKMENSMHVENQSATSSKSKRPRKVRYYIREYGDVSAASDNEALYRSMEINYDNETNVNQNDLEQIVQNQNVYAEILNKKIEKYRENTKDLVPDQVIDKAILFAQVANSKSQRIKKKLLDTIRIQDTLR